MNIVRRFVLVLGAGSLLPLCAQEPAPAPAPKPVAEGPVAEGKQQEAPKPKLLELGQRVSGDIVLRDIDGKQQRAKDLMGKVTVVNFYSIQCPIQRDWDSRLAQIQKDYADKGVVFLHIDSNTTEIGEPQEGKEAYGKIRDHLKKSELPFRVLVDHDNVVADVFQAQTTPHVYVFGVDGRLVYKGLVDDDQKNRRPDERQNYVRDTLDKLLAGEKVEPFSTKEQGCTIKRVGASKGRGGRGRGR